MRWMPIAVAAIAMPASVAAADCSTGSVDIIELLAWSVAEDRGAASVTIEYVSKADAPIQMIDATTWFYDALDRGIGGMKIDEDLHLQPGEAAVETRRVLGLNRLLEVRQQDIHTLVCVKAVLFEDGTTKRFDE